MRYEEPIDVRIGLEYRRLAMKFGIKRIISLLMVVVFMSAMIHMSYVQVEASTVVDAKLFSNINASDVFLKQPLGSSTCTLYGNAMMLRRAAIIRGDSDWKSITADAISSTARLPGVGVYWYYTYKGLSVSHTRLPLGEDAKKAYLIELLKQHPEGVVLFDENKITSSDNNRGGSTHAILLTDYTDGVFYYADPNPKIASGRIPMTANSTVTIAMADRYWYVKTHVTSLTEPKAVLSGCSGGVGTVTVNGWAFNNKNLAKAVEILVYVGTSREAGGTTVYKVKANAYREDVDEMYGVGKYHGFNEIWKTNLHGTQKVYVYAVFESGATPVLIGSKTVNIAKEVPCTGIVLNKTNVSLRKKGESLPLTATIQPGNATNKSVVWRSSNTAVATVNSQGVVTAVGEGNATITVTTVSGGKVTACDVEVIYDDIEKVDENMYVWEDIALKKCIVWYQCNGL